MKFVRHGFSSKHFGLIHLAGLRVLNFFFNKKNSFHLYLSPFSLSSSLFFSSSLDLLIFSSVSSCRAWNWNKLLFFHFIVSVNS